MTRLSHTIRLVLDDDRYPIQRSRELWSYHLDPRMLLIIVINLAALAMVVRDIATTLAVYWNEGICVLLGVLLPVRVGYATG